MYSHCISCSRELGSNEHIETFPVGRRVAFDPERGRLWVICGRCARWNLAPIEERWEPVEEAEKLFRDTRQRVQRENIGLARLPDGTRLVRIGAARDGELAAWRYGRQLQQRRLQWFGLMGAAAVTGGVIVAGAPMISAVAPMSVISLLLNGGNLVHQATYSRRVVARIDASESPTGRAVPLRRAHLFRSHLEPQGNGVALRIDGSAFGPAHPLRDGITLQGHAARRALSRVLVDYNQRGGSSGEVGSALAAIADAGSTESFLTHATAERPVLSRARAQTGQSYSFRQILGTFRNEKLPVHRMRSAFDDGLPRMNRVTALAVEIALNEGTERAALEGELIE
ncbi:MAG TPA: hypothetical protein VHG09_10625, partial [Longimicrobiales bacterium]|nr:hypothetical protein [Longimicrobiales bacterium]